MCKDSMYSKVRYIAFRGDPSGVLIPSRASTKSKFCIAKARSVQEALYWSIRKWEFLERTPLLGNAERLSCALCRFFSETADFTSHIDCSRCPIMKQTHQEGCQGTPYRTYIRILKNAPEVLQYETSQKIASVFAKDFKNFLIALYNKHYGDLPQFPEQKFTGLKAYVVWEGDTRAEYAELVFADTCKTARNLAWKHPYGDGFEDFVSVKVKRLFKADSLSIEGIPYVCTDDKIFRKAGFTCEGYDACISCGLYSFGLKEYEPCPECYCCPECGHDSDCPQKGVVDGAA